MRIEVGLCVVGALVLLGACCRTPQSTGEGGVGSRLKLIDERPIAGLLSKGDDEGRLEASGVAVYGEHFYVVLDNVGHIARLKNDLSVNPVGEVWQGRRGKGEGYEALTWSPEASRFYAAIESVKVKKKTFRAVVHTFDPDFEALSQGEIDFDFKGENKGIEGLAAVQKDGETVLLALCEAPGGQKKKKKKGRSGLILVLEPDGESWAVSKELALPSRADFEDFSDLAIDASGRTAVVSQEDGAMWVGQLDVEDWSWADEGVVFELPLDEDGKRAYCNIEGVDWMGESRVVLVSDRAKAEQPARCRNKEQSIHIFELP